MNNAVKQLIVVMLFVMIPFTNTFARGNNRYAAQQKVARTFFKAVADGDYNTMKRLISQDEYDKTALMNLSNKVKHSLRQNVNRQSVTAIPNRADDAVSFLFYDEISGKTFSVQLFDTGSGWEVFEYDYY